MIPKPQTHRSRKYKAWIREQPCIACMTEKDVTHHHLETGGGSMKGDDRVAVPLCPTCHGDFHYAGMTLDEFESKWQLNIYREAFRLFLRYLDEQNALPA